MTQDTTESVFIVRTTLDENLIRSLRYVFAHPLFFFLFLPFDGRLSPFTLLFSFGTTSSFSLQGPKFCKQVRHGPNEISFLPESDYKSGPFLSVNPPFLSLRLEKPPYSFLFI